MVEGKEGGKGRAGLGAGATEHVGGGGGRGEELVVIVIAIVVAGAKLSLGGVRAGRRGMDATTAAVAVGTAATRHWHG